MKDNHQKPENPTVTDIEWKQLTFTRDKRDADMRRVLDSIPLFDNLNIRDWRELTELFHRREFTDQEIVFEIGTPGLGMYIIIEGQVTILGSNGSNQVEIARLGQGDFFGEMSLVDEINRSATAMTVGPTRLIGIFRPQLRNLMQQHPRLGLKLMEKLSQVIAKRLREADRKLSECRAGMVQDWDNVDS